MHTPATDHQWISFRLQDERYAQPVASVKEVIEFVPPAPVPGAPDQVLGVLNVRGEVITVVSGHRLLDAEAVLAPGQQRILIIDSHAERFGIVVDTVEEIVQLDASLIEPTQQMQEPAFLLGTARYDRGLLIMVDLTRCAQVIAA